ncbi:MAG: tyrosine-type recombinase/integrase [Candidatus Aenigmarchaeota archaeon]|nr:tyrosine-type recombinase/integrase [Candidatus Aenigmarchaeota archaeon]
MSKVDIHRYKQRVVIALKKLERSKLSKETKQDVLDFHRYSLAKGISGCRMAKYIYNLVLAGELLDKSFTEATKDDLVKVVNIILEKEWSPHTKHDFNVILKRFYKWLEGGDEEYPKKVKWIPTSLKYDNKKLPEELLSKGEVIDLIEAACHMRDKALISVLYESGCRIGEVLSLRIKHVTIDDMGGQIIVDGKTGMRRMRLIASIPYVTTWLEHHPLKNDPEAPLWPIIGTRSRNKFLKYQSTSNLIKNLAKRAGIKKRVHPHIFRHSRATHLANVFTEAQMNHYFG